MRSLWVAVAVSAAEQGCSVLLLEKQPQLGGTTGIAMGSFTANRTPMQRVAGVDDSLEDRVEDAGRFAPDSIEARNNAALHRWFLSHYAETLDQRVGRTNPLGTRPAHRLGPHQWPFGGENFGRNKIDSMRLNSIFDELTESV